MDGNHRHGSLARRLILCALLLAIHLPVGADEDEKETERGQTAWLGKFELKRQLTNRGTEDEKTLSQVRLESYPGGPLSFVRIDVPLPDEKQSFAGDPAKPRLGDIKIRLNSARFRAWGIPLTAFVEAGFPTANPPELGTGKLQISLGARHSRRLFADAAPPSLRFAGSVQITESVSVTGDPSRKEINTTKFEFGLQCIRRSSWVKVTFKPNIDWVQDGKTGAVVELRGQSSVSRPVALWLMLGTRLWGPGVSGTYEKRLEAGAICCF